MDDAVELAGGVVLDLAIGRDLALQLDQLLGPLVHAAEHAQADGAEQDQQRRRSRETRPAAWSGPAPARARPDRRRIAQARQGSFTRLEEVAAELLLVEPIAEILYAHDALPVDERGQERVVDRAVRRLGHRHAVAMRHLEHRSPARRSGSSSRRDRRRTPAHTPSAPAGVSRSGSTVIETKAILVPKSGPSSSCTRAILSVSIGQMSGHEV